MLGTRDMVEWVWARLRLVAAGLLLSAGGALGADVNIGSNVTTGVNLDLSAGTTAEIAAGTSVSNASAARAVTATTSAWALTNRGSVSSTLANTIALGVTGSSVINHGSITATGAGGNAIVLVNGGDVDNKAGATITSATSAVSIGHTSPSPAGGAGTLTNAGTITQSASSSADLVQLRFGGTVTNLATGVISANSSSNAVSVGQGTSRTVVNSGVISNTSTGSFATGVLVQGGASTVTNTAGGQISSTFNGVYASSTSPLTLGNGGSISTTRLSATAHAVQADGGGTITNTGTISSAGADGIRAAKAATVINSGTIGGATNAITFTGAFAHTLELDTGSVLNGNVVGVTGGAAVDSLVLLGNGTESLGKFQAFETLSMQGTAWTLTGSGALATSGEVKAGVLTLGGDLTSPSFSVLFGGTLTGTGTIRGAVSNAGKIRVAAGETLHIGDGTQTGSLTTAAGSTFDIGVTPLGSGLLAVTGTAALGGGTVNVLAAAGSYAPHTTHTVLTTTGGRTGSFDAVTSDLAFLAPSLSYDANNVYLTLDRNLASFAGAGTTRNQRATGSGLDSLPLSNPLVTALVQLDLAAAPAALDAVSGEIYAAAQGVLADGSAQPRDAALDRIDAAFAAIGASKARGVDIWAQGFGGAGTIEADGNAGRLMTAGGGLLLGADGLTDAGLMTSVFAGIGHTAAALDDRQSSAALDSYQLGLTMANAGDVRIKVGAIVGLAGVVVDRRATFAGFSDATEGSFTSATGQVFGELSYALRAGGVTLTPFAQLALLGVGSGAYAETGGAAALTGHTDAYGMALSTIGLRAGTALTLGDGLVVRLDGKLGLQQRFGRAPTATHHFAGGDDFTVAGAPTGGTMLLLDAGVSTVVGRASLGFNYAGKFGAAGETQAVRTTLSGAF